MAARLNFALILCLLSGPCVCVGKAFALSLENSEGKHEVLKKRLNEAKQRGGDKEVKRVLLDDLASLVDDRSDGSRYGSALLKRIVELRADEALENIEKLLYLGNPDNNSGDPYDRLFNLASEAWIRLKSQGGNEQDKLTLAMTAFDPDAKVPLDPDAAKRILLSDPKRARKLFYDFLLSTKVKIGDSTLRLWQAGIIKHLLLEEAEFTPSEFEIKSILDGPYNISKEAMIGFLVRGQDLRVVPVLEVFLKSDVDDERGIAMRSCSSFAHKPEIASRFVTTLLSIAHGYPAESSQEEVLARRGGVLGHLYDMGKNPASLAFFQKEKIALQKIDCRGLDEKAWNAQFGLWHLVTHALSEWE